MYRSSIKSKVFNGKIQDKSHKIQKLSNKIDAYEKNIFCILPDEIILKIFSKLPQYVLMTCCSMVCKRWNKLSEDFSLWRKDDYEGKIIRVTHIRKLLALGVEKLDFSKSTLENYVPLFPVSFKMPYAVKRFSGLQDLHLDEFVPIRNEDSLKCYEYLSQFTADILSVCACLKVLKLRGICLNSIICRHISMNKDIKELYWISCFIKKSLKESIFKIFQQCKKIEILDFSFTNFPGDEMWSVTNNLQSCLNSLTLFQFWPLSYFSSVLEKHVKEIIHRCPNITYLKISYLGIQYYNLLKLIVNGLPMLKTLDISYFGCQPLPIEELFLFKEAYELTELIISKKYMSLDISSLNNILKGVTISFSKI